MVDTPERIKYNKLSEHVDCIAAVIEHFQFSINRDYESEELESPLRK